MSRGVLVSPGIDPGAVAMYGTVSCLSFISPVYYVCIFLFPVSVPLLVV